MQQLYSHWEWHGSIKRKVKKAKTRFKDMK